MTIFSSDQERQNLLIRKWYRDYLHHHIQTQATLDGWRNFMIANGVEASWVAIVESAEGEVRLAQDAALDGLPDLVAAIKAEVDHITAQPTQPGQVNVDALTAQITALEKHLGVGNP